MIDVSTGQQKPAAATVKSLWVRNNFNSFSLKPCYGIFINKLPVQLQPLLTFFHAAVLICAQIYTVYVAMYQSRGVVCLTSTAVFTCFIFCFRMCANTQNRSTRKNLNIAKCFSSVFFQRLASNLLIGRWQSLHKHFLKTDQVTLDQRIFLLMISPMEERTKIPLE